MKRILGKYDNLGQVFKNLRTNRHISLKQISNEKVSAAQISRFERGESDISLERFLIALDNMHIEVSEFIDAVNNYQRTEQIRFMSALIPLEYERNIKGFRKMQEEEEQKFREHPEIYRYHLNVILLQSFICKCDEAVLFPKEYLDKLKIAEFYMEKIEPLLQNETDLYKRAIYLFLSGLLHYKEGKKQTGIDDMQKAIHIFEWVGSENLANNYKKDFARFVC